ncbi:hypothetical protein OIU77_018536 [Salix suchowensis]|uniref:Uncharacterized protein n=1 Tax=Salix suchowensis TaxID=1278906 RepID=A0ABQ9CG85_9ROSI|nr:hypothetical protein OIU77_018536 [Salix suchowensis]
MASDDVIVRPAFMEPWKLKEIVGKPVSGSFWREWDLESWKGLCFVGSGVFCCMIAPFGRDLVIEKREWEV